MMNFLRSLSILFSIIIVLIQSSWGQQEGEECVSKLNQAEEKISILAAQLAPKESEWNTCEEIFKRVKELESTTADQVSLISSLTELHDGCKSEVEGLSPLSEKVKTCENKIQSHHSHIEFLTKEADGISSKLAGANAAVETCNNDLAKANSSLQQTLESLQNKETAFKKEIQGLKDQIIETEKKMKAEKNELDAINNKSTQEELSLELTQLNTMSHDKYIFSYAQFRRTLTKTATFNKVIFFHFRSKIESYISPAMSDEINVRYAELKVALMGIYSSYMATWKGSSLLIKPYLQSLRSFYVDKVEHIVNPAFQTTKVLLIQQWELSKQRVIAFFQKIENAYVQPFIRANPVLKEIVPESAVDRCFALMYFIIIIIISAYVLRFAFFLVLKVLRLTLRIVFLPCRMLCYMCCKSRMPKSSKRIKPVKHEVKQENFKVLYDDTKQEYRKETPGKRTHKKE